MIKRPFPDEINARTMLLRINMKAPNTAQIMNAQWYEIRNDWQNDDWYDRAEATATFYDNAVWDEILECWTVPLPVLKTKVGTKRPKPD